MTTLPEVIAKHIEKPGALYQLIDRYQQASAAAWLAEQLGQLLPGLASDVTITQQRADEAKKQAEKARGEITQIEAQMAAQAPNPAPDLAEDRHQLHLTSGDADSHARTARDAATAAQGRYDMLARFITDLESVTAPSGDEARAAVTADLFAARSHVDERQRDAKRPQTPRIW